MITEPPRIDYASVFPPGMRAMVGLQRAVESAGLEPLSEQRLHLLAAWREASCYDARERVALAWCEDLTLISKRGAPDAVYEELEQTFSPQEIVALTVAIVAINGWNRLAISMRTPVGSYVSPHHQEGA